MGWEYPEVTPEEGSECQRYCGTPPVYIDMELINWGIKLLNANKVSGGYMTIDGIHFSPRDLYEESDPYQWRIPTESKDEKKPKKWYREIEYNKKHKKKNH